MIFLLELKEIFLITQWPQNSLIKSFRRIGHLVFSQRVLNRWRKNWIFRCPLKAFWNHFRSSSSTTFEAMKHLWYHNTFYTGCPVNWYSLSISIPDFPGGTIRKVRNWNRNWVPIDRTPCIWCVVLLLINNCFLLTWRKLRICQYYAGGMRRHAALFLAKSFPAILFSVLLVMPLIISYSIAFSEVRY